jgi:hypothetical protein
MEYQGIASHDYYNYPKVQLANTSHDYNNYFASNMNSHVGVASYNNSRYVASANIFDEYHDQEPMFAENSLSLNSSGNIQHVNPYSSAVSSQYVVPSQVEPMNERIGYDNDNYLANYSQNSAPYASASIYNSASYVTPNSSRINKNSARDANANAYNSASYVTLNSSRTNDYSQLKPVEFKEANLDVKRMLARSKAKRFANNCDSALYDLKSSRINKDLAHAANPHGSFKWKVPTYHRPYPLHIDYMNAPHGWRVPNFYEFSGEGSKTAVEHIRLYLAQLGSAGREDCMRIRNFPLSLTDTAFAWFTSLPECIVGSWIELEELFYEYFGKTNVKKPITIRSSAKQGLLGRLDSDMSKSSAFKVKQHNITSESITSQETSLATEKHVKHKKSARLDFSGVKGTIYLSSDYCIINEDQVPKSKKEVVDSVESAQPTDQPAKPTSSHTAGADASLDNSAPVVDCFLEMKNNIIQIKDLHFSDMIHKVQSTSILPNSQSGHIISIDTSISNILASCVKRQIEEGIVLINNEMKLDYIGQPIIPYQEVDDNILSKLKLFPIFTLNYTFICVVLLALNSIHTWSQMRYKFCNYFGLYNSGLRLKNIAHADVDFIFNSKTSGKKGSCKGVAE